MQGIRGVTKSELINIMNMGCVGAGVQKGKGRWLERSYQDQCARELKWFKVSEGWRTCTGVQTNSNGSY